MVLFVYAVKNNMLSNNWLLIVFFSYALVYRNIIDFYRLKTKGILTNKDFFKLFVPGIRMKYFKELYWM